MPSLPGFFFCCIFLTGILTFAGNVPESFDPGFGKRESRASFLEHFHWFLNVKASVSITVYDAIACALECLRHSLCFSFNIAISPSKSGHDCQLLGADKYTFADRFQPSQFYHHYSMASQCEYSPCMNGATCRPLHRSDGYFCKQSPGNIEQGAPWIKLNQDEVCFGAKNDSYGNFTITSDGTIIALKLVYISGFVTCNKVNQPYGSHWACQKGSKIAIIVTNTKKEVMFPQNYQNQAYVLPGYHENSSELVFSRLSPPLALRVAAGEEYWVWYHEDFMDKSEYDNGGHTCVDVYAL